jgi:hypothetical protein
METALSVSFERYRAPGGVIGQLASTAPLLPANLAGGQLTGILGLDTLTPLVSDLRPATSGATTTPVRPAADGLTPCAAAQTAASPGYFTFDALGAAYGLDTLLSAGQTGSGQTVALYELGAHSSSDVSTYQNCFGISNPVSTVAVDGGATGGVSVEADSDIEEVATEAPTASLVSYEGPDTTAGAYDTWNAIVAADTAQVISTSWDQCELDAWDSGTFNSTDTLLKEAVTQGQTVLVASGDDGSEGCWGSDGSTVTYPMYPASDPSVTAVGGTTLFGPGDEVVWNDCEGATGTTCASTAGEGAAGGGLSHFNDIDSWQPVVWDWSVAGNPCGMDCRQVPDISSNAGIGMVSYFNGGWFIGAGTSLAAPLLAGVIADKNSACVDRSGLIAQGLYGLYDQGSYGTAFNDITIGDNDFTRSYSGEFYPAGIGYDDATGIGSPISGGFSCAQVNSVQNGYVGQQVVVNGLGLNHALIYFGGTEAHVVASSPTQATVVVPTGSGNAVVGATSWMGQGIHAAAFAYQPAPAPPSPPASSPPPPPSGYDLVGHDGGVFVFPVGQSGGFYGSLPGLGVHVSDIVGMVPTANDQGYFLVGQDGGVFAFGNAPFENSLPGLGVKVSSIVGIVPTSDDQGYFLVGSDGGVFTFGNAPFLGSLPGIGVHVTNIIGIAANPSDSGYWLVAANGTVYSFGSAVNFGSATGTSSPVSAIESTPDGGGYWIVTQNGSVYTFGDAGNFGSLPGIGVIPAHPVIGLVPTSDDGGYWLIGSDGGIFAFGDAPFVGSLPGLGVSVTDIVGAVPTHP